MKGPMQSTRLRACALGLMLALSVGWAQAAAPSAAPASSAPARSSGKLAAKTPRPAMKAPIDINSASRAQLKALPGIGDVEADRIISGRPYHSKADLAERNVIPTGVYVSLKGRIVAKQKAKGKVGVP